MSKNSSQKLLSILLCIALIAAMALCTSGCGSNNTPETTVAVAAPSASGEVISVGQGETNFTFTVVDLEGNESVFDVHTDEKTVGAALLSLELIAGDEGDYGLYVKTVNGITLDYDKDGKYWAFYVDGEYAATGVDATDITPGTAYSFKAE